MIAFLTAAFGMMSGPVGWLFLIVAAILGFKVYSMKVRYDALKEFNDAQAAQAAKDKAEYEADIAAAKAIAAQAVENLGRSIDERKALDAKLATMIEAAKGTPKDHDASDLLKDVVKELSK